jgi:DNA-directed RNA polymerase alpha subunit
MKNRVIDFLGKVHYSGDLGTYIWSNNTGGNTELIAIIEGYRSIQELCRTVNEANDFQDEMGRFIAEAINEKIERSCTKVDKIHIEDTDASVRLLNILKGASIMYLDELSELTLYQISMCNNMGIKSLSELQQIMDKYKIKFKAK